MRRATILMTFVAFLMAAGAAYAAEGRGEVSVQGMGFFTKNSDGHGNFQKQTESGGLLVGYRRRVFRFISAEAVYGYSRNSQQYVNSSNAANIQSNIHEATGGFVVKLPFLAKIEPYALAEGGALVFDPRDGSFGQKQARGTFVYGGGVNVPVVGERLFLKAEYRGLVYKAPNFGLSALSTDSWTHTAQPSAGFAVRF
jgi:outer membrane immunogenic protein